MNGISLTTYTEVASEDSIVNDVIAEDGYLEKRNKDIILNQIKNELVKTEWTTLPDSPLTEEKQQEWNVYRNGLQNLLISEEDNLIWPVKPA